MSSRTRSKLPTRGRSPAADGRLGGLFEWKARIGTTSGAPEHRVEYQCAAGYSRNYTRLALSLVLPGEVVALPDIRPSVAAGVLVERVELGGVQVAALDQRPRCVGRDGDHNPVGELPPLTVHQTPLGV